MTRMIPPPRPVSPHCPPFRPQRLPLAAAVAACLCALPAVAAVQDPVAGPVANETPREPAVLDTVVVTGSHQAVSAQELPYSISARDETRVLAAGQPGINVAEWLKGVPGVVVQNRQNHAQDLQISSRGFGARSAFGIRGIRLISDDIPATTPDGQGQSSSFDTDVLSRIEVLRGPFASVYGSNAGGVIQLFSRDGEGEPTVSAGTTFGSWDSRRNRVTAEGGNDRAGFLLNHSRFDSDGYRDHSRTESTRSFAKVTVHPGHDDKLTFTASALDQDSQDPLGLTWARYRDDPSSVEAPAKNFNTRKTVDHRQGGVSYERRLGSSSVQASAYAGQREVVQFLAIPAAPQANARHAGGVIDLGRDFHGGSARFLHVLDSHAGPLTLIAGLDYDSSSDDRSGYENFIGTSLGVRGNLRRDERNRIDSLAPYAQASWSPGKLTVQAGIRHNRVRIKVDDRYLANGDDSGSVRYSGNTPSIGAIYALTPDASVYASWGRGFETPTTNELSYSGAGGGFGFDLEAATSSQAEVGLKQRFGPGLLVNAALFQIETKDEIVVASASGGRTAYQNASRTRRQGAELAVEKQVSDALSINLSYTWLRARYDEAFTSNPGLPSQVTVPKGNRLPGMPSTQFYGELAWKPVAGLNTALEVIRSGKVHVNDSNQGAAPGYTLVNLRARAEQKHGAWTLAQSVQLNNLQDRRYVGSVIVGDGNGRYYEPGADRHWYAGMDVKYAF